MTAALGILLTISIAANVVLLWAIFTIQISNFQDYDSHEHTH